MYSILWAEDDRVHFEQYQEILHAFLTARNLHCRIIHAVDGNEVYRLLGPGLFVDLLVVDIDMPNWNGFETARDIASRFMGLPIIVVSAKISLPEIRSQLDLMLLEGLLKGSFYSDDSDAWCEAILNILEDRPITLLHFSDIHFGRFYGLQRASFRLEDLISNQFDRLIGSPRIDALVVSGDFCSLGLTQEFEQAAEFLDVITSRFSISRERVVLVPGNHDIYRPEEEARRFTKFVEFINSFYSTTGCLERYGELFERTTGRLRDERLQADSLFCLAVFNDLKMIVFGLNSVIAREQDWNLGEITGSQLLKVQAQLERLSSLQASFFRMAVFHHHLFEVPSIYQHEAAERTVLNQGLILRHLIRHRICVVLHGHTHYGAGYKYQPYFFEEPKRVAGPIHVFSTGTLSGEHKASAQYSYQCNVLRLLRAERVVSRGVVIPLRLIDDSLEWRSLPQIEFDVAT